MKAITVKAPSNVDAEDTFILEEVPKSIPEEKDLLVRVLAVSVNPVDTKVRKSFRENRYIGGWDAVGLVEEVGSRVSFFRKGDKVYYAGDITKQGSNAEYQIVDERIVGKAPKNLSDAEIAALPLTALTAWEAIFDRLRLKKGQSLLVIGGAGGVGSIAIQLAKYFGIKVSVTASRPESRNWCLGLGAENVFDHSKDLTKEINEEFDAVFCTTNMEDYWNSFPSFIKPQGSICLIDDPSNELDIKIFKTKAISIHWELMFTRSLFQTEDMHRQHEILTEVAKLVEDGKIKTTLGGSKKGMTPENFREVHKLIESQKAIGKWTIVF